MTWQHFIIGKRKYQTSNSPQVRIEKSQLLIPNLTILVTFNMDMLSMLDMHNHNGLKLKSFRAYSHSAAHRAASLYFLNTRPHVCYCSESYSGGFSPPVAQINNRNIAHVLLAFCVFWIVPGKITWTVVPFLFVTPLTYLQWRVFI